MKIKFDCDEPFEVELEDAINLSHKCKKFLKLYDILVDSINVMVSGREKRIIINSSEGLEISRKLTISYEQCNSSFKKLFEMILASEVLAKQQKEFIKSENKENSS